LKKLILGLLLLTLGCENLSNTPIRQVEATLKKYQTLDYAVISDLDEVVNDEISFSEEQREEYRNIMKKHYQNLVYEIKDEEINGDDAIVTVEITVTDFNKVIDDANLYLYNNPNEFNDEEGNYMPSKFIDYRLEQLSNANEKVKYTLDIEVNKVNGNWVVKQFSDDTLDKINGIYNY